MSVKYDQDGDCGRWREDFCMCVTAMPEQIHSLEYTAEDELQWLQHGVAPRSAPGSWARVRRQFREEYMERVVGFRAWREEREQARRREITRERKHVVCDGIHGGTEARG